MAVFFDTNVSAETGDSQNKSIATDERISSANDNGEKNGDNFSTNEMISTTTARFPFTLNEMTTESINNRVRPTATATAATATPSLDTDYHSMKRAFDKFNEKMDFYMAFYGNEMSFLTIKLNSLRDKLNTLETLHHEIDQVVSRQNTAEQKLHAIHEAIYGSQSINGKLDRLELLMQQMYNQIDDLMEKQRKIAPHISEVENRKKYEADDEPLPANGGEQCETKIEQLVAFVHSFAELNRLENSDILNRLGNMQSQLIQFFDVKGSIPINQIDEMATMHAKQYDVGWQNSSHLNDTQAINGTTIQLNSTEMFKQKSIEMPTLSFNQTFDIGQNMSDSNSSTHLEFVRNRRQKSKSKRHVSKNMISKC